MEVNRSTNKMGLPISVMGTLILFGIAGGVLLAVGRKDYPDLHTILDTGMFLMSGVLALLLWDMSTKVSRPFLRWTAISFGFTALLELVHALVTIEWSGPLSLIAQAANTLRPATWPPAAFILPIGLGCSVWLMRRGRRSALGFSLVLIFLNVGLLLLFYKLPRYTLPIWLGITRPALIPAPLLWAIVGWACWTFSSSDRLLPPLALMATVLVIAHVSMLYSRAPHDAAAMVAHLGKVAGYLVLFLSVMHLASVDMSERIRAERELAVRQQAEETLRKSHAQLRLIIEAAPSAMLMVNDKGLMTLVNKQAELLFGYGRDELISQAIEMLVPERYRGAHPGHRTGFFHTPSTRAMGAGRDLYGRRKDGSEVPIEICLNPIGTDQGAFVLASIIDITERKKGEQILRESEERLHTIIENLSEGLVISDLNGQLLHWNQTGLKMHGFSSMDEWLLRVPEFQEIFELSTLDGSVLELEQWPLPRIINGEHLAGYVVRLRRIDTDWSRVFSYGGGIVNEPNGQPLAFVTITDITESKQAEEKLRRSQEQLAGVIGSAMDGIISVDEDQRIVLFNTAAERMFLYLSEDAIGQPLDRFIPERFRATHKGHIQGFGKTQMTRRSVGAGALYGLRADGEEFPIEASISQIESDGRKLYTVILRDVTERKRAEGALKEQARILDLAPVLIRDLNGRIILWNAGAEQMYGWKAEEALEKLSHNLLKTEFPRPFEEIKARLLAHGQWEGELVHTKKDGQQIEVASHWVMHRDEQGKPKAILEVNNDITERKEAEREIRRLNEELEQRVNERTAQLEDANTELRHSQAELNSLFESLPGLYLVLTPELKIVSASDAYLKATMTTREGILGRNLFEVFPDNPDDHSATGVSSLRASIDRVMHNAASDTMAIQKYDVRRPDGVFEERYWSPINSPVLGADGQIKYIIHRVEEVTEFVRQKSQPSGSTVELNARVQQMEAEIFRSSQDLQASNQQLEATNKELESFSYSVSHDLRAPLRHINGFSQALLEDYADKLDETGKGYLQEVRSASQEMAQLIDDVLELARVTRSEMRREVVNLSEMAQAVLRDLQKREPQRTATVNLEEGLSTLGDKRLLRIVLTNLLGNAWKFTSKQEQAEITFGSERKNGEISYFVRDNGAGFDMAYVNRLFGAFQRLHTAGEFEGTGIGLATVQRVINRHGGRVRAEGIVNEGATFYFSLAQSSRR